MAAPALPLRRKLLYAALLAGIAVAALVGTLETALRLVNYGHSAEFARRVVLPDGQAIWRENRWCTAPFFSPALVRRPVPFRLPAKKTPGTYRIFVLGSSAAMGDPEASFSFARVLEAMLQAACPQQRFEVVNAAITATNSHVMRGIAEDCAQLEPDLFIVYEGHNEVIGPFGPAAVFAPFLRSTAATRVAVWLKKTRTGQLLAAVSRNFTSEKGAEEKWGGMQMFMRQQLAADDSRLDAVRGHFRKNLLDVATAARRAGARTLLCTVLANQRDFAPFLSQHRPALTPPELSRWDEHFAAAEKAAQAKDLATAETEYRAALALDDRHAELVFRLGRLALETGRTTGAKVLQQRALDLDALRFRTDSTLNQVIRDLGSTPALQVVDVAENVAARSEHGIPGDDLLYEHVHLTFRGACEVARELLPAVIADLGTRGLAGKDAAPPLAYEEARLRLGYTVHEQAMISIELLNRFRSPPFTSQSDNRLRTQTWERRVEQTNALLSRPDALPALRSLYHRATTAAPDDWMLARNAGMMFVARGAPAEALPLLQRAAAWIDDDVDTLLALGAAHRALGQTADADAVIAKARALEPRHPALSGVSAK